MPQIDVLLKAKADISAFNNVESDIKNIADKIGNISGGVGAFGAKLGIGILGAQNAASLLKNEIKHVIDNIEKIPGVPGETIDSIHRAKEAIEGARLQVDQWLAKGIVAFTKFGEGIGNAMARVVYGSEAVRVAQEEQTRATADAALASAEHAKKMQQQATAAKELVAALASVEKSQLSASAAFLDREKAMAAEAQFGESLAQRVSRLKREAAEAQSDVDGVMAQAPLGSGAGPSETARRLEETAKAQASASRKRVELRQAELELSKSISEESKKESDGELAANLERVKRLQIERSIATQRGDKAEVNRLLNEERDTLGKIVGYYQAIADNANSTPAEREAALARIASYKKSDAGTETSKIGQAQNGFDNLSNPSSHFQSAGEGVQGGMIEYLTQVGTMADQIATGIRDTLGSAVSGITSGIMGWVNGTMTWKQALANVAQTLSQTVLQTLIQIGVQQMLNTLLTKMGMISIETVGDGLRTARVVKENAAEASMLPMKTAGAAASGISSMGMALVFGAIAIALIMGAMGGFATGGYTSPGAKDKPAGVVHAGEWVAPKWMVDDPKYGGMIASLESARNGMPGYTVGGFFGGLTKSMQKASGFDTWGQFLGSGGLNAKLTGPGFKKFQSQWNLLDGTKLYGGGAGDQSTLYYDGKNWVKDQPTVPPNSLPASRSGGSSFGGGSFADAGSGGSAGSRPTVNILLDKDQFARMMQEQSSEWFEQMHADQMRKNA